MAKAADFNDRRAIVTGAALLSVGLATPAAATGEGGHWRPTPEPQDDWMDLPGSHRFVFDTTSFDGLGGAIGFADTYYAYNKSGYGLAPKDLAVIIIMRHFSTVFGYSDVVWAKYGGVFGGFIKLTDPATKKAPVRNLYLVKDPKDKDEATTLQEMQAKGVQFAVCGAGTERLAGVLAKQTKGDEKQIHQFLKDNLIPTARLVPAGIIAVNRAQERGYALAWMG
jgi:intracellular sulfur oxidation DsrE/DsrF family protein